MIEQLIYEYLGNNMDVPVYLMRPDDAPVEYVIIEKTSGGETNRVANATIAVQTYGADLYSTVQLNEQVKTLMAGIEALPEIGWCRLQNDYNFADLVRKVPRYQAVFDVRYY